MQLHPFYGQVYHKSDALHILFLLLGIPFPALLPADFSLPFRLSLNVFFFQAVLPHPLPPKAGSEASSGPHGTLISLHHSTDHSVLSPAGMSLSGEER